MRTPAKNMNIPARNIEEYSPPSDSGILSRSIRPVTVSQFQSFAPLTSHTVTARHWLLEVFVAGRLYVRPSGDSWVLRKAGTGMLYSPGTQFSERSAESDRASQYKSLYVIFADDSGELGPLLGFSSRGFCRIEDSSRQLEELLEDVVNGFAGGTAAAVSATGSLLQVIGLLLSAELKKDSLIVNARSEADPEMVLNLHSYMRENLSQPIRISDLADYAGMSESALSHSYKRITGRTPMQVLREFRIEAARLHLLRGALTLETIAELTGFADAFHLSRTFKRITGLNPKQLRSSKRI